MLSETHGTLDAAKHEDFKDDRPFYFYELLILSSFKS